MKRVLYNIITSILLLALGFGLCIVWFDVFTTLELVQKVIISIGVAIILLFIESIRPVHKKINVNEEQPIIWRILKLDNEKDTSLLRDIQSVTKKKLLKSNRNQMIIQATKELCGKNCKCPTIKKKRACTCKMFDEYVEYLIDELPTE